ncbi:FAD-dependent oxidoreductase [Microbacterium sp. GXS0129]|uniref:FAD-dependent oxidoreductase n=1 Tax=Microbacterium sp. GXS0129 TaxID=3377836 RepID=UPI00383A4331
MARGIVVVGGGVMGLATGWALARAGARPIVLERFARGHHHGASHGRTRNFNDAYSRDEYLDLLVRARELWALLSAGLDQPLIRAHGLVNHGPLDRLLPVQRAHAGRGIRSRLLDPAEAGARFTGMRFAEPVLLSESSGAIRAAMALRRFEAAIRDAGGDVRWSTPVRAVSPSGRVTLPDGSEIHADRVMITAGAWTRALVPATIPLPGLRVTEEHPAHFRPRREAVWPSFNHLLGRPWPADVYGMPTPGEGIKVGFHLVGEEVDPDQRPHRSHSLTQLRDYVREWFPGLDADTAAPVSCTYTSTADEDFHLDRSGRIVVGAGFSGHGFKFAPAIGEVLARLALEDDYRAAELFRRIERPARSH